MPPKDPKSQPLGGADVRVQTEIQVMLETWLQDPYPTTPTIDLQLFRNHNDSDANAQHTSSQERFAHIVQQAVASLSSESPQDAQVINGRFLDNQTAQAVANQLELSLGHYYRVQKRAIERLAATIQKMGQNEKIRNRSTLKRRLEPPTYINLLGVEGHLEAVAARLCNPAPPWLFSIEGLGGIGKTSLAHALASHTIDLDSWENVVWVTAQHSNFNLGGGITPIERPALTVVELVRTLITQLEIDDQAIALHSSEKAQGILTNALAKQTHLIIIDNLETVADLQSLLPLLRRLANPTKFLLTTRESLRNEPDVSHFVVPALSEEDALRLVRQEADRNNLPEIVAASDDELRPIYDAVGGNPLALRLFTGQLHVHSLKNILADLIGVRSVAVEALYTYIYRQLWEQLDEQARLTLLAMPLVSEQGGTIDFLTAATEISPRDVSTALNTLVRLNLIDIQGDINQRTYSIHGLTRTFLHEQVVQWQ